jgi:hypothetical protein
MSIIWIPPYAEFTLEIVLSGSIRLEAFCRIKEMDSRWSGTRRRHGWIFLERNSVLSSRESENCLSPS